jgi:hypothetical protein
LRTVDVASTPLETTTVHRPSFVCDVHSASSQSPNNDDADDRASVLSTYTADATDNDDDDDAGGVNDDYDEYTDDEEGEGDSTLPPLLVLSTNRGSGGGLHHLEPPSAPYSAGTTRSSYMTNDTGTASRISGLSDFPIPPTQTVVSLERVEVLKSHFGDNDGEGRGAPAGPSQS